MTDQALQGGANQAANFSDVVGSILGRFNSLARYWQVIVPLLLGSASLGVGAFFNQYNVSALNVLTVEENVNIFAEGLFYYLAGAVLVVAATLILAVGLYIVQVVVMLVLNIVFGIFAGRADGDNRLSRGMGFSKSLLAATLFLVLFIGLLLLFLADPQKRFVLGYLPFVGGFFPTQADATQTDVIEAGALLAMPLILLLSFLCNALGRLRGVGIVFVYVAVGLSGLGVLTGPALGVYTYLDRYNFPNRSMPVSVGDGKYCPSQAGGPAQPIYTFESSNVLWLGQKATVIKCNYVTDATDYARDAYSTVVVSNPDNMSVYPVTVTRLTADTSR